jgi:hypothetical protein
VITQRPCEHAPAQVIEHPPQLLLSLEVSTHAPEQNVFVGHTHALFWQVGAGGGHVVVVRQCPARSHVWMSLPEHCVSPGLHGTQAPRRQIGVAPEQGWPAICQMPADVQTSG